MNDSAKRSPRYTNQDPRLYIEVVKPDEFPTVFELGSAQGLKRVLSSYGVSRNPKNGDRLILQDSGIVAFSKISGRKSLALGIPIGVNSASVDDLRALPGIGTKLPERIVKYRELKGGFKNIDELINVEGIGKKKIEAIRPFISLD
jgi:competence ComEA-like helix-hairpin-helix protein